VVGDEALTRFLAIGVGCRLGCQADAIEALVRQALAQAGGGEPYGLFTIIDKADEPGLRDAARILRLDLAGLPRAALHAQSGRVRTRSAHASRLFGVESVAEAAALAGAMARSGAEPTLLVSRMADRGATCAIATAPA